MPISAVRDELDKARKQTAAVQKTLAAQRNLRSQIHQPIYDPKVIEDLTSVVEGLIRAVEALHKSVSP